MLRAVCFKTSWRMVLILDEAGDFKASMLLNSTDDFELEHPAMSSVTASASGVSLAEIDIKIGIPGGLPSMFNRYLDASAIFFMKGCTGPLQSIEASIAMPIMPGSTGLSNFA